MLNLIKTTLPLMMFGFSLTLASTGPHAGKEGKTHVHGSHDECALPKSTEDIISCALDFHPSMKRGMLSINSAEKLEEQASQLPNPSLSGRYVKGDDVSDLETNLNFTLEVGGKRGSRKEYARAKRSEALGYNVVTKAELKFETISNLYRLRQLRDEKKALAETIGAYAKVVDQLKKLPRLSAEQEASLTLFDIALEESKFTESELFEEERKLEHFFHIATGHSLQEINDFLPAAPTKWPQMTKSATELDSPEVGKLTALADLAQKELEMARSDAWPDITIGPSFSIERDGAVENKLIGFNIQIPVPVFHANGGGKAFAQSEVLRARRLVDLARVEESHERVEQLKIYESTVRILSKTMKQGLIESKHTRIEKLYHRGVVSSSVFLESLKQKFSYLKSRNNRELTAIHALWNIHKYDGKIFEEKI